MAYLKLGCLNLKLHLHIGNICGEGLVACPPAPAPTFGFNDQNTHKHQKNALNAFGLDLVKSRGSCNNNNNNNNNNIHSMTSMTSLTLPSMTLTLHLITTCLIRSSRHLISIIMTSLTPH